MFNFDIKNKFGFWRGFRLRKLDLRRFFWRRSNLRNLRKKGWGVAVVGVLCLVGVGGTMALNGFFGGGAAIPEDTMTRGLVGYWSFDEGDGAIARDASGNNNHGTLTNGPKWTQGKSGGALQFDGKDDYVDAGNGSSLNITDSITLEAWVFMDYTGSKNSDLGFIAKESSYLLYDTWGELRVMSAFWIDGAWRHSTSTGVNSNQWYHLVTTYSSLDRTIRFYIDGNEVAPVVLSGLSAYSLNISANNVHLGNGTLGKKNRVDEARIYNRVLTAEEVRYHYNHGGPVAQWDMDEGSGSVINDKSGNNNNGTLVNGTTWVQGKHGSALSFDGADDYAVVNDNAVLRTTGDWTRSIWVNSPVVIGGDGTTNDIWTQRTTTNKFLLRIDAAGKWALYYRSTGAGFSSFFVARAEAGVWQNIVAVKSGTSIAFYIDGKKVASATNAENFPDDSHQIYFGSLAGGASQFFNGEIDEVKIYDYARTEEEIRLDYNAGLATHLGPSGKTCSEDPAGCMDFGLAGHWDMDEGSGSMINDKSGNNNHGTLTNGPQWTQGKNGGALQFDGKDDYVNCGNKSSWNLASGDHAIGLWFKASSPTKNYASLVRRFTGGTPGAGYFIGLLSSGKIRIDERTDGNPIGFSSADNYVDNKWHNLIYVVNDSAKIAYLYVDGKFVTSDNYTGNLINHNSSLGIGGSPVNFNGLIDEVRIYNRALSAEEVRYHYNRGGPVAEWDMDEGSGSVVKDGSGNGNDGTISGAAWTQGKHGSALSFSRANKDNIQISKLRNYDFGSAMSVGLWLNHDGTEEYRGIVNNGYYDSGGFEIRMSNLDNGSRIGWGIYTSSGDYGWVINSQISPNVWHYVYLVYDGSYLYGYVDGVLVGRAVVTGTIDVVNKSIYIGQNGANQEYFNGLIDDVKIYDYARTEEEIRLDYNAGLATYLGPSGKTCSEDPAGCMDYGLAGHWDMDEGSGTKLNDKSGNNNHGTLTSTRINGPQWTKGKNGSALQFDGKDDYVSVADSDSLTFGNGTTDGGFSIESWINYDLINSFNIARKTNEYWLTNSNCLRLYLYDASSGGVIAKSPICLSNTYKGKWVHLIVTYDGSGFDGINYYINGNQLSGGSSTGSVDGYVSMENTTNVLSIGSTTAKGKIDGVKIYNRALSAEEVRYHYNQGKPVAQWDFDEGEGARAFDVSGNNNTGVLTNGPTWVEGKRGSALSFDGTDDYVSCGNKSSLDITKEITLSAWIKPNSAGEEGYGRIFRKTGTDYELYMNNGQRVYASINDSVGASHNITSNVDSVPFGQWSYITVTYDGATQKMFVNGIRQTAIATWSGLIKKSSNVLYLGNINGASRTFDGYLDEVKIYNYARTEEQIMQDYNAGVATHLK